MQQLLEGYIWFRGKTQREARRNGESGHILSRERVDKNNGLCPDDNCMVYPYELHTEE
mgnify:CR=1 FL=1